MCMKITQGCCLGNDQFIQELLWENEKVVVYFFLQELLLCPYTTPINMKIYFKSICSLWAITLPILPELMENKWFRSYNLSSKNKCFPFLSFYISLLLQIRDVRHFALQWSISHILDFSSINYWASF
jgi:hypothetical protein